MSQKRAKIGKVVTHRERELDKRVAALGEARAEARRREDAAEAERRKLERAAAEREALSGGSISAADWRAANEWLESRALSHAAATHDVVRANQVVEQSQANVLTARQALKGVEILVERLRVEELKAEDRADQRLQDDLARRGGRAPRGGKA